MIYLGIDIGTTTICGLAYDPENKKTDVITLKNNSGMHSEKEWEKLQDPGKLVSLVYDILESFSTKYSKIGGIGIAGQMHGILYTDDKGNAVSPLYTWKITVVIRFIEGHTVMQVTWQTVPGTGWQAVMDWSLTISI